MNTYFIHHRSTHHAKKSGYARLLDYYPDAKRIIGSPKIPYRLSKFLASWHDQEAGLYNSDSVYKELELRKNLNRDTNAQKLVHYLNSERDIRHVVQRKSGRNDIRFCGTFHKPPEVLSTRISNVKYVSRLDGAVAVGANQVDYLKDCFKINNVKYIPHGIDTQFFYPNRSKRVPNRILFVGQHLRDFDALNYCIPILAERIKDLTVNIVLHQAYKKKVKQHSCISIFTALNDDILLSQYQEASLLFLPMLDSTACNSILEALACGVPIVTNTVGGNEKYLESTDSALLQRGDYDGLIESTHQLLQDHSELDRRSHLAIQKANAYDWKVIAQEIKNFHDSLWLNY